MTNADVAALCDVTEETVETWRQGLHLPAMPSAKLLAKRLEIPLWIIRSDLAREPTTPLDAALLDLGITSAQVAVACETSPEAVRMWRLGGRKPGIAFAKRIHKAFAIPLHVIRPDVWDAPFAGGSDSGEGPRSLSPETLSL